VRLFKAVLDYVQVHPDMVNRALDVAFDPSGTVTVTLYALP